MNEDRVKIIAVADAIRALLAKEGLVGVVILAGRGGMLESRLAVEAPWFKAKTVEDKDHELIGLHLQHKAADPHQELIDTLGALSGIADILTESSLALGAASRALDEELGATHTPITKV